MSVCETVISLDPLNVSEQPALKTLQEVIGQFTVSVLLKKVSGSQLVVSEAGESKFVFEASKLNLEVVAVPAERVFMQGSAYYSIFQSS